MPRQEMIARVGGKQAIVSMVTDAVGVAVIAAGTDLKLVANVAVGYNNVDVAAGRARGVIVTNTPDVLTDATADFTLALILAVTRRLGEGERMPRPGRDGPSISCSACSSEAGSWASSVTGGSARRWPRGWKPSG